MPEAGARSIRSPAGGQSLRPHWAEPWEGNGRGKEGGAGGSGCVTRPNPGMSRRIEDGRRGRWSGLRCQRHYGRAVQRGGPDVPGGTGRRSREDRDQSYRRFVWGSAVGIVVSGAAFAWLVTAGTFQFFQSVPFSNFYDAQVRSWFRGTWSVPANVLSIEGIRTGGRTDMYYGPVPALLRLPVLIFTHRFDGRLTEPSLLIAFLLALTFASLLSWRIRGLVRGPVAVSRLEAGLTAALLVVIGLGSVFLFLGATAMVYEEAEMWGAAFALGAFYSLVGFLDRPSAGRLVSTGVLTTLALLTRASVGLGPILAIGLATVVYLFAALATRAPRWLRHTGQLARALGVKVAHVPGRFSVGLLAAMGIPLAIYAAINQVKFDTPFSPPFNRQVYSLENAHRQAVLASNGGSLYGLKYLPSGLLQFVRPDALSVTRQFPWVFFPGKALVIGHPIYDSRAWTSSVPASMPVLFLLALVGVVVVFRPARFRRPANTLAAGSAPAAMTEPSAAPGIGALRLPIAGAAAGTVGILIWSFIAERYLADVMPLLLLAGLAGWHFVLSHRSRTNGTLRTNGIVRTVGVTLLAVLVLFEVWTTFSLSLFYQRELGPVVTIAQRAGMVTFQQQVGRSLLGSPTSGVQFVPGLPASAPALNLAVVGNCASVYQFDGNSWQPVELGAAGGARQLEVTFPRTSRARRQPLLVTGGATPQDVVAVTWEGGDLYNFSSRFAQPLFGQPAQGWYTEPAVVVAPGHPHQVQVDLDTRIHQVFITMDGALVFSLLTPVAPPTAVRLGSVPPSITTTPVFAGRIRALPVPTPICHQLERDRADSAAISRGRR